MPTAQMNWVNETAQLPMLHQATEDCPWYAVQARVRFEKKVFAHLTDKGIETFLPLVKHVHQWSDRRKLVDVPLFPGYGFVHLHLNPTIRLQILRTAGLIGFVRFNGEATPVPEKQIQDIQQVLTQDFPCTMYPFLRAGQRVRIRGGCLDGIEGILIDRNSDKRLLISVESIQRTMEIHIEGYDVELL
jgi:transcription antitermination factor NusG